MEPNDGLRHIRTLNHGRAIQIREESQQTGSRASAHAITIHFLYDTLHCASAAGAHHVNFQNNLDHVAANRRFRVRNIGNTCNTSTSVDEGQVIGEGLPTDSRRAWES